MDRRLKKLHSSIYEANKLKWKIEHKMHPSTKVFSVTNKYTDIKEPLIARGWFENTDPNSEFFDFKWTLKHRDLEYKKLRKTQIVNHFQRNAELSTKVGLLHNLKNLTWFDGTEVDSFYPNSYDLADVEVPDFIEEFKLTKAESILKSYLGKEEKLNSLDMAKLLISMNISERRLTRLEELLDMIVVNDSLVSDEEWELLLCENQVDPLFTKYPYLHKRTLSLYNHYRKENEDEHDFIKVKCRELIRKLKCRYPQTSLNGVRNLWIAKPAGLSRGRGIHIFTTLNELDEIIKGRNYIVQKYIENPLIILDRKFDIRQWVLVTSWNPLIIWIYKEFYVRFSAEDFDINKTDNNFIHLTNNSITKYAKIDNKIEGNMWSQDQFITYLKTTFSHDVWEESLRKKVYEIIVQSIKSTQDVVIHRDKCFELFGYDIMIDEHLNPWLIEVNCSPAVDYSTVLILLLIV